MAAYNQVNAISEIEISYLDEENGSINQEKDIIDDIENNIKDEFNSEFLKDAAHY
jgi:hypothetical protein